MTECDLLCLDLDRAERLRAGLIDRGLAEDLALRSKALAEPTRIEIATALRDGGELCVCDLSWVLSRAENAVSHHLRLMRTAGVTASRRDGKMVLYSLTERGSALLERLTVDSVAT